MLYRTLRWRTVRTKKLFSYIPKVQGHEKLSKIVDRSGMKSSATTDDPIFHVAGRIGLERRLQSYHKSSPIRWHVNNNRPFYTGADVGEYVHLQDHFQKNIHIHSLSTDAEYVDSIYKSHDFYNSGEREHQRRQYSLKTQYSKAMDNFCAIDAEVVKTEHLDEAVARVTVMDGNFNILLDEFIIPPGGEVMDYKYNQTGITPFDIEEKGKHVDTVRQKVVEAIGKRTIIGHQVGLTFSYLEYLPNQHENNAVVDLAHDNRVNFEVMVRNNQRHKGSASLNTIGLVLVNKDIRDVKYDTVDDCTTMVQIFHYMYHKMYEKNRLARHQSKMKTLTSDVIGHLGMPKNSDGKRAPSLSLSG